MKNLIIAALAAVTALSACQKNETPEKNFTLGKNNFITTVDGDSREYIVHVPAGYDGNSPVPVVFFLHGASGSGEGSYISSGWKELAESENIIAVFPTARTYCYLEPNGTVKTQTRWNSLPGDYQFCADETPRDDIKFLRTIISELGLHFNVDSKRIYIAGFSSGAQMAFRCAIEMSDAIAAIVESGASHYADTVFSPVRNLPITFQLGNADETWLDGAPEIPMNFFDSLLNNYYVFKRIIRNHTESFDFESTYTMS
ncbi:MAG: alpha/beta hydrolase family esterase, partial [Saprospiraceae bacterium]